MDFITVTNKNNISTIWLERGKVNAINEDVVAQLYSALRQLEADEATSAVILTGVGDFFSFGFDIPEFYHHTPEEFRRFVVSFTNLYTYLFLYPKPVIAALNGHTIAGGCMLSNACDYRIVAEGKAKVALNELAFGSTVFAGSVAILRAIAGQVNAERVLITGYLFDNEQALKHGLVNEVIAADELMVRSRRKAEKYGAVHGQAYASIKRLLRQPIVDSYRDLEEASIDEFIDIWYSDTLRENLKEIKIRK
ncbi:MAG: enoyl-CoA hydratase/isomerase family protein [Candidatus Zixiibacteriota bacterium]